METLTNQDILDWTATIDVQKQLGALTLNGVSDAERRLMHEAIVYDRVFLMTTAIGVGLLELKKDPENDKQLIDKILVRLDKFERRLNGENVDEETNYINFWEIGKFVKSQNPKAGSDTRIINLLFRSSQYSPAADGRYTAGLYITHIDNLVILRTDVPAETPLLERWVVDMRALEEAHNNGALQRINGISYERLKLFKALIDYWKGIDLQDSSPPELTPAV